MSPVICLFVRFLTCEYICNILVKLCRNLDEDEKFFCNVTTSRESTSLVTLGMVVRVF